jgi:2-oxoisovalerate dehydrogenase E1 component
VSAVAVNWQQVARFVLLSRSIDQLEEQLLAPQGKVKYQFSAMGHELAQVLLALHLDHPHDAAAVYYRSRPFMLACGLTPVEALAAGMARSGSPSQGRDVGVVFNLPRRDGPSILPSSGDVGAQYTPAAGWAQAITYRHSALGEKDWENAIAVVSGGDGSVATNGFWSALTIATTLNLPLLFFIEDNQYGISVPSRLQTPGGDIAANLASFKNLRVLQADGTDPLEACQRIGEAVAHVRSWAGPCLLRLRVPRLRGHTFIDDQAYKTPDEHTEEAGRDPLTRLYTYLSDQDLLDQAAWEALTTEVDREVSQTLEKAEALPDPAPDQATRYLFFEGDLPRQGGLRAENAQLPVTYSNPQPAGPRLNLIDAVRRTLENEMSCNTRLLVFGEDVGVKGGVHGATLDMQAHFGSERVFDTSLSEEGIIGRSVGLALAGLLPVPEIQFRKYADPAHEQIGNLGTLRWRTANNFAAPVVVRIPVGFGKRTGDPWHSVTGEAIYAHLPGWRIAFPSNAQDAVGLLRSALRGDDPTFFFEHRALLDTPEGRRPYPGDEYCLPFGKANLLLPGDELLIVSWGALVHRCLAAAEEFPRRVAVLDLRTILPWDQEAVLEQVRRTGKILIVQEDSITGGFAAEIAATIADQAFTDLDAPVRRLATPDVPIPYNLSLMESVLPNQAAIRSQIDELLAY